MVFALCMLLILCVPLVLASGGFPEPSAGARRAALLLGLIVAIPAALAWFFEFKTLPLIVLAFAPAYQLELYGHLARSFRRRHGRELKLIAFQMASAERIDEGRYSTIYFVSAVPLPLIVFGLLRT